MPNYKSPNSNKPIYDDITDKKLVYNTKRVVLWYSKVS